MKTKYRGVCGRGTNCDGLQDDSGSLNGSSLTVANYQQAQ